MPLIPNTLEQVPDSDLQATATATKTAPQPRFLAPGSTEFTILLALAMASTALSIDSLLPALGNIRSAYGLTPDSSETAALITVFLLGSGLALLPAGLLSDRYGRRPVLWGGFVLYTAGSIGAAFAPSFTWLMVTRLVWGIGAAGPRVAASAMVRDVYSGDKMAKQMSFMMAVFILVPVIAPTLASGLIAVAPWRSVFWLCTVAGLIVVAWSLRLPETLAVTDRRGLGFSDIIDGVRTVLRSPGTTWYILGQIAIFASFISYLGTSELILDDVYDLKKWFPLFFGALAAVMGVVMLINGRVVERVGVDRLTLVILTVYLLSALTLMATSLATDGKPTFWLFFVILVPLIGSSGVLTPNLNSAAMRPLGAVAGLATAIIGMVANVVGSLIGNRIDSLYRGNTTPLCVAFFISAVVALLASRRGAALQRASLANAG